MNKKRVFSKFLIVYFHTHCIFTTVVNTKLFEQKGTLQTTVQNKVL